MKKLNSKMLEKKHIIEKMEMLNVFGGVATTPAPNGSDRTYNDTYNMTTKRWDIARLSAMDIDPTSASGDNPNYEPPTQTAAVSLSFSVSEMRLF